MDHSTAGVALADVIAWIIYRTCRRRDDTGSASVSFSRFVMVAAGVLSLVALAWLTLPAAAGDEIARHVMEL
jgi:hypothetical protein